MRSPGSVRGRSMSMPLFVVGAGVAGSLSVLAGERPRSDEATTAKRYAVPLRSPPIRQLVAFAPPVQVAPPGDAVTAYPVIVEPLVCGRTQVILTALSPAAVVGL